MIPLKVTLKNFLSYGPAEQTVVFEPYSLICLSGKNGHGKSSILDAITWAIWGCARKMVGVAKGDDGLVHLGQKEMVVHLYFLVNSQKYRIRREYFKSYGKPITRLDIETFDAQIAQFVTLTDKSVRATQEKIERIVGLDFETFVSTSFLRQGQSNEFSKKTPRERKEVIAAILGLGSYDQKAVLALEKSKEVFQKITQVKLQAEQAKGIVAQVAQIDERMVVVQHEAQHITAELLHLQKKNSECTQRLQQLDQIKNEIARLDELKKVEEEKNARLIDFVREKFFLWRGLHKRLIRLPSLDLLVQARTKALDELNVQRSKEKQSIVLQQKIQSTNRDLEALEVSLRHEHELKKNAFLRKKDEFIVQSKYLDSSLADLIIRKDALHKQLAECRKKQSEIIVQLANREQVEAAYDAGKRLFEKRRAFYHACVSKRKMAEAALHEITDHKNVVSNVENPSCPLCQQLVTIKRKFFLINQLTKQELFQQHKLSRVMLILTHLETVLTEQRAQLEREARACMAFQTAEQDLIRVTNLSQDLERELQKLCEQEEQFAKHKQALEKNLVELEHIVVTAEAQFATTLHSSEAVLSGRKLCAALQQELVALAYLPEELEKKSEQVVRLDSQLKDLQQRDVLFHEAMRMRHAVQTHVFEARRTRAELIAVMAKCAELNGLVKNYHQIAEEKHELDKSIEVFLSKRDAISREQGSLSERKKRCDEAVEYCKVVDEQIDALMHEKKDYDTLAEAYGKNGIQALLIESILPEIEQEANTLLARLTDNQMQIFIESLRDLKGGGVRETLDIQISDSVGVRPYEMFSGGEAFRIDFALRIAVSRLLARRAGTHLQTLMIDEGFGSQDDEGLSRLTQALFAVQKDFEKIIVVSHLERLKESFPVHVVVEKRAGSSIVHVEERG